MKLNKGNSWKDGPILFSGNWEPLIFWRRMGGAAANATSLYQKEHTEELVKHLEELGINLFITHYFKGFGLKAEAEDIEYARKIIALCHKRGIKAGGYIGDTIILETMLAEEPEVKNWYQFFPGGQPVYYGGIQTFRFKWCRTNPAYLAYMKKVLTQALHDGLDLVHFDNFVERPEPMSCHCRWCTDSFREFLQTSLTPEQRKERFGFSDMTYVIPPVFSAPLYSNWQDDVISNPLLQEWIRFRCFITTDRLRQLAEFCRGINPEVAIECNPSGIWGENTAYMRGVNHATLLPSGEFFWDESPNPYGLLKNGAICTHIRTMKMGESLGNKTFYYSGDSETNLAEGMAFNQGCLGMVGFVKGDTIVSEDKELRSRYAALLREHTEAFCQTRSVAQVAVYRDFTSLAFNSLEPQLQAILAEETLLEHHIPFDIITTLEKLPYKVLLLPGTECLGEKEIGLIERFVKQGGQAILTGDTAKYDAWRREQPTDPFARILSASGKKSLVRLPALELPKAAPSLANRVLWDDCYRVIDARFWILPKNAAVLLGALEKAELTPYSVDAPRNTVIEPRIAEDGRTLYVHIIHYDQKSRKKKLVFSFPKSIGIKKISLLSPRLKEQTIPFTIRGGTAMCSITTNAAYATLVISLEERYA